MFLEFVEEFQSSKVCRFNIINCRKCRFLVKYFTINNQEYCYDISIVNCFTTSLWSLQFMNDTENNCAALQYVCLFMQLMSMLFL